MKNLFKVTLLVFMTASLALLPSNARTASDGGAGKMDLQLRMLMDVPASGKAMLGKAVSLRDGAEYVEVLVKTSDADLTGAAVGDLGGSVRGRIGRILAVQVPLEALAALSALPEVSAVEASKELHYFMDTARSSSNADVASVQSTYDGANVVVGAIDSGLDYSQSDFASTAGGTRVQYLCFQTVQSSGDVAITQCAKDYIDNGDCSIPASNDSTVGHGTHVTGIAAGSDDTYTGVAPAADIMLVRNDYDDDINEGSATSGTFSGGVIDGVVEIFKKADILDKPAVINLSQGTHIGAHDNTSLLEEALNSAVGGGYADDGKSYGRVIAVAAGNEHVVEASITALGLGTFSGGIHADVNVPAGTSHAWRIWVISAAAPGRTPLVIDGWFGSGQSGNCKAAANAYQYGDIFTSFPDMAPPAAAPATSLAQAAISDMALSGDTSDSSDDGTVSLAGATDSSDSQNGKPRAIFSFGPASGASWNDIAMVGTDNTNNSNAYYLDVILRAEGGTCSGDLWIEGGGTYVSFMGGIDTGAYDTANGSNGDGYEMQDGDNNSTVAIPATASGVIAVGSYLQTKPVTGCSQSCWTDVDGVLHDATDITAADAAQAQVNGGTVQARSPFSSIGPPAYAYSGYKPDVMAPGDPIISVRPSGFTPAWDGAANDYLIIDSSHYKSQGTSQASPVVAGIVALLLTKNNTLTASQAKAALTGTASKSSSPTNQVGYGNVNAAQALASVSSDTSGYSGTGDLSQSQLDGGGGGGGSSSSSCGGTIAPPVATSASPVAIIALLPLFFIAVRCKGRE